MWGKNVIGFHLPPKFKEIPLLYFNADYDRSTLSQIEGIMGFKWGLTLATITYNFRKKFN